MEPDRIWNNTDRSGTVDPPLSGAKAPPGNSKTAHKSSTLILSVTISVANTTTFVIERLDSPGWKLLHPPCVDAMMVVSGARTAVVQYTMR